MSEGDYDKHSENTIYTHKMGMYKKEEYTITLKSDIDSIDALIIKAKGILKDV